MKAFLLALLVLGLIFGALILTGAYLKGTTAKLAEAAGAFPLLSADLTVDRSSFLEASENFSQIWTSSRSTVRFAVGHRESDRIEAAFADLQARFLYRDNAGYMSARATLLHAIEQLASSEEISIDSIT